LRYSCSNQYYRDQSHRFVADGRRVNFDHPSSFDLDMLEIHPPFATTIERFISTAFSSDALPAPRGIRPRAKPRE
jgi:hypothetical protein